MLIRKLVAFKWAQQNTGQPQCQRCPNKGPFQQGNSAPGATSQDQCSAQAGALGTCSQASDGTCPPTTGGVTTTTTSASSTTTTMSPSGESYSHIFEAHLCIRFAYLPYSGLKNHDDKRSAKRYCPAGWKVCPIHRGTQWSSDAQECVNVMSDLESCGGCVTDDSLDGEVNSDGGRDCSAIPHVGTVRCLHGGCVIGQCSRPF